MKHFLKQDRLFPWSFNCAGNMKQLVVFSSLAVLVWSGCSLSDGDPAPAFRGLATLRLTLTPEELQTLTVNRNLNVFVAADLVYDYPDRDVRRRWAIEMRNAGQFSRRFFKKNFHLQFPPEDRFFGKRILNLSAQPTDDTKLRSLVGYTVLQSAGFHVPELEPVALYLNDEYQGLYYLIEPIDKEFFDRRGVPVSALFEAKLLEAQWEYTEGFNIRLGYNKLYPDDDNFSELERLLRTITEATPANLEVQLAPIFDLSSYITYQASMVVIQNFDSWTNNFHLYHDDRTGTLRLQPWDVDHAYDTELDIYAPTVLNDLIVENPLLRRRYLLKVLELLDGPADPAGLQSLIRSRVPVLAEAYNRDPYHQAAGWTMEDRSRILEGQITAASQRLRAEAVRLLQP